MITFWNHISFFALIFNFSTYSVHFSHATKLWPLLQLSKGWSTSGSAPKTDFLSHRLKMNKLLTF